MRHQLMTRYTRKVLDKGINLWQHCSSEVKKQKKNKKQKTKTHSTHVSITMSVKPMA